MELVAVREAPVNRCIQFCVRLSGHVASRAKIPEDAHRHRGVGRRALRAALVRRFHLHPCHSAARRRRIDGPQHGPPPRPHARRHGAGSARSR